MDDVDFKKTLSSSTKLNPCRKHREHKLKNCLAPYNYLFYPYLIS